MIEGTKKCSQISFAVKTARLSDFSTNAPCLLYTSRVQRCHITNTKRLSDSYSPTEKVLIKMPHLRLIDCMQHVPGRVEGSLPSCSCSRGAAVTGRGCHNHRHRLHTLQSSPLDSSSATEELLNKRRRRRSRRKEEKDKQKLHSSMRDP